MESSVPAIASTVPPALFMPSMGSHFSCPSWEPGPATHHRAALVATFTPS
jgi:hypothetical protein